VEQKSRPATILAEIRRTTNENNFKAPHHFAPTHAGKLFWTVGQLMVAQVVPAFSAQNTC